MSSVDVVIPCYNYAGYLETCVDSVLSQRDVDVRVLIIDDQSPDNTPEVCDRLARRDPRVSFIRNPQNLGLVGTANRGVMDWATAKYTLLISADDALTPGALARATHIMDQNDDIGMVYGMAQVFADNSEMTLADDPAASDYRIISGAQFLAHSCAAWCGVASPAALIRTEVQHKIGGLNPKFPHTCDMEIWMRLATRAPIAALRTTQAYYRRHDANMSIAYIDRPLSDFREQLATALDVKENYGGHLSEFESWIDVMRQRMVTQACWLAGLAYERGDAEGAKTCIEFAAELSPTLWRSRAWWSYQAKRALGPALTRRIRSARKLDLNGANTSMGTFRKGELFGWWPESSEGGAT